MTAIPTGSAALASALVVVFTACSVIAIVLYYRSSSRKAVLADIGRSGAMPQTTQSSSQIWRALDARVGETSKIAGIGFVGLTAAFLLLSYFTQFIVFEVDSIISFLAALVLLFTDSRKKANVRVLDAVLASSDRTISEIAPPGSMTFTYTLEGKGVSGVSLVGRDGSGPGEKTAKLHPPGSELSELFVREAGVRNLTWDSLEALLPAAITETFGLANSVSVERHDEIVSFVLRSPSFECPCSGAEGPGSFGVVGCTIASFLAVLACGASASDVQLMRCKKDRETDTWEVSLMVSAKHPRSE